MTRDKHGRLTRTTFNYGNAQVTLVFEDDTLARVIDLYSEHRGRGEATAVMAEATSFADKHGIALWLEAKRYGNPRGSMDNLQLVNFYQRFGFDIAQGSPQPYIMTREPLLKGDAS